MRSGDWAGGAPAQARELVRRVSHVHDFKRRSKHLPNIFDNRNTCRWKLITVQLGGNDLCSYECGAEEGDARPEAYKVGNTEPSVSMI